MMKLLTLVWTLAMTLSLCCDGAIIYDPMLQQEMAWYNPEIQYSELVDKKSVKAVEPMDMVGRLLVLRNILNKTDNKPDNNGSGKVIETNSISMKEAGKRSRYPYFDVPYNRF